MPGARAPACRLLRPPRTESETQGCFESGLPFVAMELLDGRDLRCVLQACGRMAPAVVVQYAIQASSALSEVHELGLVHCDVKPANLFLAAGRHASARIKLLDFGIARSRLEGDRSHQWSSPNHVVDPRLASIVETCLQKDRRRRFSSMDELSAALLPLSS